MSDPFVIAVCHQKGGVAKTTTVSSVGACLAEQNQRVLLVDLDPSANLTAGLGLNPAQISRSAADVLLGNDTLAMVRQPSGFAGIDLVPSNAEMLTAFRFLHVRPQYEHLLERSITQDGLPPYDFVLMDCPPSLGAVTISAAVAADLVLIPTQCEYYALQALDRLFKAISQTRARYNPRLRLRLLVTMFDQRGHLHSQVLAELKQRYAGTLMETIIGFDGNLRKSQFAGEPVTHFAPASRAASQYRSLAEELRAYVQTQTVFQPA